MTSSGMKRGLATVAVSALAVTGLPALAGTASADPIDTQVGTGNVEIYTLGGGDFNGVEGSTKFDGTNDTISLVAGAGSTVTSIQFQYRVSDAAAWQNIGPVLTRNADGAFQTDWAAPANLDGLEVDVRAVPNVGTAKQIDNVLIDIQEETVELGTEGALGIYTNPHNSTQNVAVRGTASSGQNVGVWDETKRSAGVGTQVGTNILPEQGTDGVWRYEGVLTYPTTNLYHFSTGPEANQVVLAAANDLTDDAEASTYYVQSVSSVTATPKTTKVAVGGSTTAVVTVVDAQGKPVAGVTVGYLGPDGSDADTNPDDHASVGTTDANGQVSLSGLTKGTYTAYADSDAVAGHSAGDKDAASFTISEYVAQLNSVTISSLKDRKAFDIDEITADTFQVTLKDNEGNPFNAPVQYRWSVDNPGTADDHTGTWTDAGTTGADGVISIPFDSLGENGGNYTLEARHPNEAGTGLMNATPMTFEVGESEITFDEGTSAEATSYSTVTYSGNLALVGSGTDLAGRTVTITYSTTGDSVVATTQPSGTTKGSGNTATAVTDANGNFSVTLSDPAGPPNVTPYSEVGTLTAEAVALHGTGDASNADAMDTLLVNWGPAPTPASITIDANDLFQYENDTPGRPVDFDVVVKDAAGTALKDFPVEVTVDHGFVTPGAGDGAGYGDDSELTPDPAPVAGANYGEWKDLGATETVSTGDGSTADFAAAIERDAGFDDDGLVNTTVTVKAGSVTKTYTINWNSSDPLNPGSVELVPVAGESTSANVGDTVEFNVFAKDQFGNLVGNEQVQMFDNTTSADFTTDYFGGYALSDFTNSGPSVIASSDAAGSQVLEARWNNASDNYTNANGAHAQGNETVTDTATVTWSAPAPRQTIQALLKLRNQVDGDDVAKVNAPSAAAGARVKLFKIKKDGTRVLLAVKTANAHGNAKFVVNDNKPGKVTTYKAKVGATAKTFADWTPKRSIK
jgi:hypothetical protein